MSSSRSEPVSTMDLSERMTEQRFTAWADEIGLPSEMRGPVLYVIDREYERGKTDTQTGVVSAADVVAWLRSPEWDGDATWEHYARAIARDIEKSVAKGRIPVNHQHRGAV